MTGFAFKNLLV